ncbi:uncharacterized protein A4U43_C02F1810 [Asparagus officinalis]|uniref:DYW domain-containing protein n=1 Tax=Asparagus officinalis TaxID=4686 RepID=A0A5P1FGW9_ASPOF|nr:pentatricopeptide repeat-containing protein At5g42450, mitochondrial [Asparagus officinalis]ONK76973.1 uncharacterized protein A4U43_C02F1810 [Asparagus officinalis]
MKSTLSILSKSLRNLNPNQTLISSSQNFLTTQKLHAQFLKTGVLVEESVTLLKLYCQSSQFQFAHQLFDEIPNWDLVSATSLIGSFTRCNRHRDAISLFSRLPFFSIRPNQFTFGTILRSAISLSNLNLSKQLHSLTIKMGLHSNVFVGSSLVDIYAKLGNIEEAKLAFDDTDEPNVVSYTALVSGYLKKEQFVDALRLFRQMPEKNVVSWNAFVSGCSQIGRNEESVNIFVEMCREGIRPTPMTFPCVLTAASNIASLGLGRSFHALAVKSLAKLDVFVSNALVSLYSKCGSLEDTVSVFERIRERNVVSWNSVICGFAQNGKGEKALEFYEKMRVMGVKPNSVTLLGLLFGCNHAGLVDEGYKYFNLAKEEDPNILRAEHYACMVDLLSRSGRFDESERFLKELPFDPGVGFWKAMLGGCQIRSKKDLASTVASHILALDPKDISSYVLVSNVFSSVEDWGSVSNIRREMKEKGMKRIPGCSWIEIKSKVVVFFNGDRRHPKTDEIHTMLDSCLSYSSLEAYGFGVFKDS